MNAEEHREQLDMYFGAERPEPRDIEHPDDRCELCGQPLRGRVREFYITPDESDTRTVVAHDKCGDGLGLEEA